MPGYVFIAGPHNGMTFCGYKLRLQTDPVELVHQPVRTFDKFFLVLVVSRNARKPQERIILLKMIIAHAPELRPTATNREPVVESRSGPHASGPYREGVPLSSQCTRASPFIVDRQRAGQSEQNARAPPHQRTNTWFLEPSIQRERDHVGRPAGSLYLLGAQSRQGDSVLSG